MKESEKWRLAGALALSIGYGAFGYTMGRWASILEKPECARSALERHAICMEKSQASAERCDLAYNSRLKSCEEMK